MPTPFASAVVPSISVPMRLPMIWLLGAINTSAPDGFSTRMPGPSLPLMMLRSAAAVPPMVLKRDCTWMPAPVF